MSDITEDQAYLAMLDRISVLVTLDPEPGTPEGDELLRLSRKATTYELGRFRFVIPTAEHRAAFRRDQEERHAEDLEA